MSFLDHLEGELARLDAEGLLRSPVGHVPSSEAVDVCTNDYLGYARRTVSRETGHRVGAGASRLVFGTQPEHEALEAEVADWVGAEAGLLFSSAYAANLGTLAALAGSSDLIVSDALNHASIVDGCRLSRARVEVVPHADIDAVARALEIPTVGRRWVVTESYFSMDADSPDLAALRALCDDRGAGLMVDEAHALGVLGPQGAGLCREARVAPDVLIAGLGKAIGAQGAVVAGAGTLRRFLWNRARSFVFSTAPSPLATAAALDHVRAARRDDAGRARLAGFSAAFEAAIEPLRALLPPHRRGPLFPILLGRPGAALELALALRERGFLAQAIRPPTVPEGLSRVRLALHADLTGGDIERLAEALLALCPAS